MEEAFHSFSAQVFTSSSVSVIVALAVRNLIRAALGFSTDFSLTSYSFSSPDAMGYLWIFIAALAAALLGVAFYHAMLLCRRLFVKMTFLNGVGKYLVPFLAAGAFGLVSVYAMGGGHAFLQSLGTDGTGKISIECAFGLGVAATLAIVVVFRFISCALAVGAGMPYGIFVPTLATGAGLGALLCCAFSAAGMDGSYADYLIIITMAAYFAAVVRAPITGLVMIFEFTGSFSNLLPALMGVAVGYIVGELFRTQPLFEKLLEFILKERGESRQTFRVSAEVEAGSAADGRRIRSLLWPLGGTVVAVQSSGGDTLAVSYNLRLSAGDVVTFEARADSEEELVACLEELTSIPARRNGEAGKSEG